jgi:hypothetical protein
MVRVELTYHEVKFRRVRNEKLSKKAPVSIVMSVSTHVNNSLASQTGFPTASYWEVLVKFVETGSVLVKIGQQQSALLHVTPACLSLRMSSESLIAHVRKRVRKLPPQPRESLKATKREPSAWEYNWITQSLCLSLWL